jgi:hypothetical protein
MKRLLLAFLFLTAFPGCPPINPTPGAATCADVCAHAQALGCISAQPTAKGASCVMVCENLQNSGLPKWNLACRAAAASCSAMDECQ